MQKRQNLPEMACKCDHSLPILPQINNRYCLAAQVEHLHSLQLPSEPLRRRSLSSVPCKSHGTYVVSCERVLARLLHRERLAGRNGWGTDGSGLRRRDDGSKTPRRPLAKQGAADREDRAEKRRDRWRGQEPSSLSGAGAGGRVRNGERRARRHAVVAEVGTLYAAAANCAVRGVSVTRTRLCGCRREARVGLGKWEDECGCGYAGLCSRPRLFCTSRGPTR